MPGESIEVLYLEMASGEKEEEMGWFLTSPLSPPSPHNSRKITLVLISYGLDVQIEDRKSNTV